MILHGFIATKSDNHKTPTHISTSLCLSVNRLPFILYIYIRTTFYTLNFIIYTQSMWNHLHAKMLLFNSVIFTGFFYWKLKYREKKAEAVARSWFFQWESPILLQKKTGSVCKFAFVYSTWNFHDEIVLFNQLKLTNIEHSSAINQVYQLKCHKN